MLIPKKLTIGRKRYSVYNSPSLHKDVYGRCFPAAGVISVASTHKKLPRTAKDQAETFWHEVTHCILHNMGNKLWRDEHFVTEFSKRLNQAVHTAKLE